MNALSTIVPISASVLITLIFAQQPPDGPPPGHRPPQGERPTEKRGLVARGDAASAGYTLLAPLRSTTTSLVDIDGVVVHEWKSDAPPGQAVYLRDNGNLVRSERMPSEIFEGGGQGGRIREFDWDGKLVWEYVCADETKLAHHDFKLLPNGHVLVIAWERKSAEQAAAAGRDLTKLQANELWPDMVLEIEPVLPSDGKLVWEWHAWDHLVQDRDAAKPNFGDINQRAERLDVNADAREQMPLSAEEEAAMERLRKLGYVGDDAPKDGGPGGGGPGGPPGGGADWLHTNSIAYNASLDLILLSSRELSEIWVIDHSTTSAQAASSSGGRYGRGGDLLFRWGNPKIHRARGAQTLFGQHDPHWIADDRILVFNNGGFDERAFSSVDELQVELTPASLAKGVPPVTLVWSYKADNFFSSHISGAQRLANGATLICDGEAGRVFEVDAKQQVVWDFLNPLGGDAPMGGPGGGPPGRGMRGGPPPDGAGPGAGPPQGGPPDGGPRGARRGPPGGRGPGGRGGPGSAHGLFRATHIAADAPSVARLAAPTTPAEKK